MTLDHAPVVDYCAHPAFAGIAPAPADTEAERLVAEIDASYEELCAHPRPASELQKAFDEKIAAPMKALHKRLSLQVREEFRKSLRLAFESAQRLLRADLEARDPSVGSRNEKFVLKGDFRDGLDFFRRQGFFRLMDSGLARRLWSVLPLERAMLLLLKKQVPTRHCVISIHAHSPAGRILRRFSRKSGLIDFASAYTGKPMEFYYAALDHAHPDQVWYQDCLYAHRRRFRHHQDHAVCPGRLRKGWRILLRSGQPPLGTLTPDARHSEGVRCNGSRHICRQSP
jgi:hypothetical protein